MSFREVYGGQDKPGRRYKFKEDFRRGVDVVLLIKPVTGEIRDAMNAKFADRKRDRAGGGYTYNIPTQRDAAATKFMAAECWDDIENGWVTLGDAEAVTFYNEQLKPDEPLKKGDAVLLDGVITEEIKTDMLSEDLPLANWIVKKATDAEEEAADEEVEEKQKNSQSSSTSDMETSGQLPIRSVGSAN